MFLTLAIYTGRSVAASIHTNITVVNFEPKEQVMKKMSDLEIEKSIEVTGLDAMGIIIHLGVCDSKESNLLYIKLRSDCEEFYFDKTSDVERFCRVLIDAAIEHLGA